MPFPSLAWERLMPIPMSFANATFPIPADGERNWSEAVNGLLQQLCDYALSPFSGVFTLQADLNFGTLFGLKAQYYVSQGLIPAATGVFRMANAENITWRSFDGLADIPLTVAGATNRLSFNYDVVTTQLSADTLFNKTISGGTYGGVQLCSAATWQDWYALNQIGLPLLVSDPAGLPNSGWMFIYGKTNGKVYKKLESGIVSEIGSGSGSGEKTYITNPSGIGNDTSGWVVSGTGALAATTTAANLPREFTTGSALSFNSSSSGAYVRYRFSLDDIDLSSKLKIFLDYISSTANFRLEMYKNTLSSYAGTYTELPLEMDVSGNSYLAISTAATYLTTFDTDTTPYLELRIVHNGTGNDTIYWSDTILGPGTVGRVPAVGTWTSYTPLLKTEASGATVTLNTGASYQAPEGKWRQVGTNMEILIGFRNGAGGAASASAGIYLTFTLPSGYTPDTGSMTNSAAGFRVSGTSQANGVNRNGGVYYMGVIGGFPLITPINGATGDYLLVTGVAAQDGVSILASIPIVEFAGGAINIGPGSAPEYAYTTEGWDTAGASTTAYGPEGQLMTGALAASRSKIVTWKYPIQQEDLIVLEASNNRISWFPLCTALIGAGGVQVIASQDSSGSLLSGAFLRSDSNTTSTVLFARYASAANDDAPLTNWPSDAYWRVRKYRNGQLPYKLATIDGVPGLYKPGFAPGEATGALISAGNIGELIATGNFSGSAIGLALTTLVSVTLQKGTYLCIIESDGNKSGATSALASLVGGGATISVSGAVNMYYSTPIDTTAICLTRTCIVRVTAAGTVDFKAIATGAPTSGTRGNVIFIRIC